VYIRTRTEAALLRPVQLLSRSGIIVQGFSWLRIICWGLLLGTAILSGCEDITPPEETPSETPRETGRDFDPATAATIQGQVTWMGAIPSVAPYHAPVSPGGEHAGASRRDWPNPHAPKIDPHTKAVAGAIVFLRGIDPRRGRPWDHPPVRVELRDYQIHVCQGDSDGALGFVRRGDAITMVSRQDIYHSLQVRDAAFFTRAFPDTDQPCQQRLDRLGIVELMSGCGYFWMRGQLFVADHPYYTRTDDAGRFTLRQVPPGQYELVGWLPDWHEAGHELDAETALICRLSYRPPIEVVQPIHLAPSKTRHVPIRLPAERFGP
jgi:hypothetical protein